MKPVATDETNFTYTLPGGGPESDLPCVRGQDKVTSTWEPERADLEALSPDLPQVILDIAWSTPVICSIRVGDGIVHGTLDEGGARPTGEPIDETHRGGPKYWRYAQTLTDHEVQMLRDGARVEIMVGMLPPPPIALQLA